MWLSCTQTQKGNKYKRRKKNGALCCYLWHELVVVWSLVFLADFFPFFLEVFRRCDIEGAGSRQRADSHEKRRPERDEKQTNSYKLDPRVFSGLILCDARERGGGRGGRLLSSQEFSGDHTSSPLSRAWARRFHWFLSSPSDLTRSFSCATCSLSSSRSFSSVFFCETRRTLELYA